MAINHVGSDLSSVLDQPLGFVSAAEGFVFLSGILTGRLDHGLANDPGELSKRARRRSLRAYLWHALGLLLVWAWVRLWLNAGQPIPLNLPHLFYTDSGMTGLLGGMALVYQPGLLDILPMYVGFPLLAPLVLRLHRKGYGLQTWVLSGSIWALDQWLAPPYPVVWGPINTGAFHFLCWQWLFVSGILLGAEPKWERGAIHSPRKWTLALAVAGVVFLWGVRRPELPNWWDDATLTMLTQKTPLALLRLLNFGLLAYVLGVLGSRHPSLLISRPIALLGRHSLPVFTVSMVTAQIALSYPELVESSDGRWLGTLFVTSGIVLTAMCCEGYHVWFKRTRKRPLGGME